MSGEFQIGKFTGDEIEQLKRVLHEACELLGVPARSREVTREAVADVIVGLALGGVREPQAILRKTMQQFMSVT